MRVCMCLSVSMCMCVRARFVRVSVCASVCVGCQSLSLFRCPLLDIDPYISLPNPSLKLKRHKKGDGILTRFHLLDSAGLSKTNPICSASRWTFISPSNVSDIM